jgi:hypothetical protein
VRDIVAARYYRCAVSTERGIRTVALPRATAWSVSDGVTGVPSAPTTWTVIEIDRQPCAAEIGDLLPWPRRRSAPFRLQGYETQLG